MQFERCYRLNYDLVAWFAHLHDLGFQPTLTNLGNVCDGNTVSVQPNAHPQQLMVLKHLIYMNGCGCGMQLFERFYSLNHGVVAWFAHFHHLELHPTLTNP